MPLPLPQAHPSNTLACSQTAGPAQSEVASSRNSHPVGRHSIVTFLKHLLVVL